jgi:hypothetical protein
MSGGSERGQLCYAAVTLSARVNEPAAMATLVIRIR